MWRPPLPEITAGKADTDCPSQGDYCEVCLPHLESTILYDFNSLIPLRSANQEVLVSKYHHEADV